MHWTRSSCTLRELSAALFEDRLDSPSLQNQMQTYISSMRADMSTDSEIYCTIPYGRAVDVDDILYGSSWVSCSYNGYYGYVMARYLSYNKPSPTPTPRPDPQPSASGWFDGFRAVTKEDVELAVELLDAIHSKDV